MAVADIIHGPAVLYRAPYGEPPPVDTVAAGAAWGGNWVKFGYTFEPLTVNYEFEEKEVEVQEQLTSLYRYKTGESLVLATTLAEMTAANYAVATSGTATSTPASSGQPPKDEFEIGGEWTLDEYAWGVEGTYVDSTGTSYPLRLFVWRGTARISGEQSYSKDSEPGIPIEIKALADPNKSLGARLMKFQRITGAAS